MIPDLSNYEPISTETLRAAQRFADAFVNAFISAADSVIVALRPVAYTLQYHLYYSRLDLQPSLRYRLAGYPFGNNRAGKKRWLRMMKITERFLSSR